MHRPVCLPCRSNANTGEPLALPSRGNRQGSALSCRAQLEAALGLERLPFLPFP